MRKSKLRPSHRKMLHSIKEEIVGIHSALISFHSEVMRTEYLDPKTLKVYSMNCTRVAEYYLQAADQLLDLSEVHGKITVADFLESVSRGQYTLPEHMIEVHNHEQSKSNHRSRSNDSVLDSRSSRSRRQKRLRSTNGRSFRPK